MAKTLVGLEITEASVRAVEVTVGNPQTVVAAGEVPLPPGVAKDSEIVDRDAVALALRELWTSAGITHRNVVLGVGNRRILVREHETQLHDPAQIRQALPFEVQDLLPVPVDQAVLDFVPTAESESGVRGLLVAAVAEHMEALVGALTQARLRAEAIDLVALGLARAIAGVAGAGQTALVLAIGEHTTQLIVTTDGIPKFVRVIPLDIVVGPDGTGSIAASFARRDGGDAPATRGGRRRRSGIDTDDGDPNALDTATQAALIDLVGRVRSTVAFYLERAGATPIQNAYVTGVHSRHPRLVDALGQVIGAPVHPLAVENLAAVGQTITLAPQLSDRLVTTVALVQGGTK